MDSPRNVGITLLIAFAVIVAIVLYGTSDKGKK